MQPATIRRLLVFGVCLLGVGGLYLVPSMAGAPAGLGSVPVQHDLPNAATSDATLVSLSSSPPVPPGTGAAAAPTGSSGGDGAPRAELGSERRVTAATTSRAIATAGSPGRDTTPPTAVGQLTAARVDTERLTVTWPAASDDRAVTSYRVWMNGFVVLDTQQRRAILPWFNDSNTHVVQVRALDGVGNVGPSSPILLVLRPSPTPAPTTASPSATPTSRPTQSPSTGPTGTRGPNLAPSAPAGSDRPSDDNQEDTP
ncbi:MAG TPA: hypothetical protein VIT65_24070 [Microlunatus sp.]